MKYRSILLFIIQAVLIVPVTALTQEWHPRTQAEYNSEQVK
jgi:hypothetical protein